MRYFQFMLVSLTFATATAHGQSVIGFEDRSLYSPGSGGEYFNGNAGTGSNTDGWTSEDVFFSNSFTQTTNFSFWSGWSYSNVANSVMPGFFNEYASVAGGGSDGVGGVDPASNYAVAFIDSSATADGTPTGNTTLSFDGLYSVQSVDLSNTTYVARFVADGLDGFGLPDFDSEAQFGDSDFLSLSITGYDGFGGTGIATGTVDVALATGSNFVLNTWLTTDLSAIGTARSLSFSIQSSQFTTFDFGTFIDTPTYFALDNLQITAVPEPNAIPLLATGTIGLRRRRS